MCICQYVCWFFELSEGFVLICNMFYSLEADVTVSLSSALFHSLIPSLFPLSFLSPIQVHTVATSFPQWWSAPVTRYLWPSSLTVASQTADSLPSGRLCTLRISQVLSADEHTRRSAKHTREYTHTQTHRSTSTPEAHNAVAVQHLI